MPRDARADRSRRDVAEALTLTPAISRVQIQQATGLAASTVASVIRDLIAEGRVRELPPVDPHGRGRPATRLILDDLSGLVLAVDVGHRHVAVALSSTSEQVLAERRTNHGGDLGADAILTLAETLVREMLDDRDVDLREVLHAVISVPAPVEPDTGRVHDGPIIVNAWRGRRPAQELGALLQIPVTATNDANAGAVGEHAHGAGAGVDDLVYLNATVGIGAGLILGGRLYTGHDGAAGEIGHIRLPGAASLCRCGQQGCLESEASVRALTPRLEAIGVHGAPGAAFKDVLHDNANHPAVRRLLSEAGRGLGSVLADICNLLSPSLVVVGGELSCGGQAVLDGIEESLRRYALSTIPSTVRVRFSALGDQAQLRGALALAAAQARLPTDGAVSDRPRGLETV